MIWVMYEEVEKERGKEVCGDLSLRLLGLIVKLRIHRESHSYKSFCSKPIETKTLYIKQR